MPVDQQVIQDADDVNDTPEDIAARSLTTGSKLAVSEPLLVASKQELSPSPGGDRGQHVWSCTFGK